MGTVSLIVTTYRVVAALGNASCILRRWHTVGLCPNCAHEAMFPVAGRARCWLAESEQPEVF
eukprot:477270-Amphidinium_carterae.2